MSLLSEFEKLQRRFLYFTPYYNRQCDLSSKQPEIYNAHGKKLHVFFISDTGTAHEPYLEYKPEYILWDRYNFGLKTHFYGQDEAFNTVGKPERKFALLNESRAIIPECYKKYLREKSYLENNFDAVFTFDSEILETLSNAKFAPLNANFWYGIHDTGAFSPDNYLYKDKNISIIASSKKSVPMHLVRQRAALKCKQENLADTFGKFKFAGGEYVPIEVPFRRYRYSIAIENDITKFYFTEKITNCFASQTIPIYLGATEIHKFFNPDGIITISLKDLDKLEQVLKQCTPQEYERRLPAVLDNFERVKNYAQVWDWVYINHLQQYFTH